MSATVTWYGDVHLMRLRRAAVQAVRAAATLVQTRARLLCNRPAKRIRRRRTRRTTRGDRGSQYTEFIGSAPGEPPMVRTSFGRRNILMELHEGGLTARIGPAAQADYMAFLELGTRQIEPRPWLRRALDETRAAIDVLLRSALSEAAR